VNVDPNEVGIFEGLTYAEYDALAGLRKSRLWTVHQRTPAHYQYEIAHPEEVETPALKIGKAAHLAMEDLASFGVTYIQEPPPPSSEKWDRRTKEHKAAWADFVASVGSRIILSGDEWAACLAMREAVLANEMGRFLASRGKAEVSIQWKDVETGLLLKGRLDLLLKREGTIVDFKTCENAAPDAFGKAAYKYGYHFQMAMYFDGVAAVLGHEIERPVLVAIEKEPPYLVACYQLTADAAVDAIELGRQQYRHALTRVAECMAAGKWPGYDDGLNELVLPPWAGMELAIDATVGLPTNKTPEQYELESDGVLGL
jgi:hypothetical protein